MNGNEFSIVPLEVIQDKRLTLEQVRVLVALFSFRNKTTNTVWPSRAAIAERTCVHPSNISEATTALAKLGWLTKEGLGGFSKSTRYTLTTPDLALQTIAQKATIAESATVAQSATRGIAQSATRAIAESATRTEQSIEQSNEQSNPSSASLPPCPHESLIDLYAKSLPALPQPRKSLWRSGKNEAAMRARWRWVMTECYETGERAGQRMATTTAEGLAWFERYFTYVSKSDFLTGRNDKFSACDLGWLVKADNFAKVLQGNYDNKAIA